MYAEENWNHLTLELVNIIGASKFALKKQLSLCLNFL